MVHCSTFSVSAVSIVSTKVGFSRLFGTGSHTETFPDEFVGQEGNPRIASPNFADRAKLVGEVVKHSTATSRVSPSSPGIACVRVLCPELKKVTRTQGFMPPKGDGDKIH